jgi:hypothetical protein
MEFFSFICHTERVPIVQSINQGSAWRWRSVTIPSELHLYPYRHMSIWSYEAIKFGMELEATPIRFPLPNTIRSFFYLIFCHCICHWEFVNAEIFKSILQVPHFLTLPLTHTLICGCAQECIELLWKHWDQDGDRSTTLHLLLLLVRLYSSLGLF